MADVAPGVITFGLGCDQTGLVIGNIFNLGFIKIIVGGSPIIPPVPPPVGGGGGGSRPLAPGEIQTFYKPVDPLYQFPKEPQIPVKIIVTFRGKVTERNYIVSKKRGDIIVNVLNVVNTIKSRILITVHNVRASRFGIVVSNIKKTPSRITTFVKNLRNKDED